MQAQESIYNGLANNGPQAPHEQTSSLPFSQSQSFSSISGPTYVTAQTLVQQVAYSLSDKLFTYSPDTFDLDVAVKKWSSDGEKNVNGYVTSVHPMQIRNGAGSIALGYMFSKDFDLKKRHIPQGFLASSSSLQYLRSSFEQLSLLYSVANPFVAHIGAVDYTGGPAGGLVTDYAAIMGLAEDLGFGTVASFSAYESQHMSLFATLLADILPTLHVYDGIRVARETTRVIDVLDRSGLTNAYHNVRAEISGQDTKHVDVEGRALRMLKAFNGELGTDYNFFEYSGHPQADAVIVCFGSVEASLASRVAVSLSKDDVKVGVVSVRVYRPFVEEEFSRVLPKSASVVGVLGQVHDEEAVAEAGVRSCLYEDVLAALSFAADRSEIPTIKDIKYARSQVWTPVNIAAAFQVITEKPIIPENGQYALQLLDAGVQQYSFWHLGDASSASVAEVLAQALSKDSASNVTTSSTQDNLLQGGIKRTDIRKSPRSVEAPYAVTSADVAFIGDVKILDDVNVLASVRDGGKVILNLPGVKNEDVEKKLPVRFRKALVEQGIQLFLVDPSASERSADDDSIESAIIHVAFIRVALPSLEEIGIQKLSSIYSTHENLDSFANELDKTLREIEVPKAWAEVESEQQADALPIDIRANSFQPFDKTETEPATLLRTWQKAAKGLIFKEAFGTKSALRPDLGVKTWTVHVQENRRLTPSTYDRNIFHIEFDLGDSGMHYEIGEALGIHAENDVQAVLDFIKFYAIDPEEVVEVPTREDPTVFDNRTVYQALLQNVDIFGRPPKRFYEALAEFADKDDERKTLLALGGAEGSTEFSRRAEVDTVTYADVLLEFPSAHPSFHDIIRIVNPMKRREYSIASCQKVTPTSVALMVVVVSWTDPQGRDRFGQATKYLSDLKVGTPVTVSLKPSVMKLPPSSTQPLIMAGLGTGLAPFRAFVQHRALEKSQGKEIGPILLYMGSRHQREEYCYGEEWEAYQDAGVITLLGRAFSRDQPQKIYIQDRMRQTLSDIIDAYCHEEGFFYLCGPTWPVPDVTNVLEEAIAGAAKAAGKKVDPHKQIEKLKDDLRYVLEVY